MLISYFRSSSKQSSFDIMYVMLEKDLDIDEASDDRSGFDENILDILEIAFCCKRVDFL